MAAYSPVGVHLNSGTDTFISQANAVFQSIYSDATGSATTCSVDPWSDNRPSPWYNVSPARTQYIWPRVIVDPTVPRDKIYITNTSSGAAATDSVFTIRNPTWATNVDVAPTNTWITINNDDIYATSDAINHAYHYILRFTQGQGWAWADRAPEQRKATYRSKLKSQMYPLEQHRNDKMADFYNVKENEIVALQLLKSMLSPERWRKYLKYGFVDVEGKSGMIYQIGRGQHHVKVLLHGEKIADLCVGLKNRYNMPPTDEVITRMIIVECDEPDIWVRANAHNFCGQKPKTEEDLARIVLQKAA